MKFCHCDDVLKPNIQLQFLQLTQIAITKHICNAVVVDIHSLYSLSRGIRNEDQLIIIPSSYQKTNVDFMG